MITRTFTSLCLVLFLFAPLQAANSETVKELKFAAPNNVAVKLRMEGPYTADVPLQVVCYFAYTPERAKRMTGAPVELDKELGGLIASLRKRNEFHGDALETILILPPSGTIKASALLLVGLGEEKDLSIDLMERVGRIAVREAVLLGADRIAFAPLLRDQGSSALDTGQVERAVTRGVLLAYDTERRLQQQKLTKPFVLREWIAEAGPAYFETTKTGVEAGLADAQKTIAVRSNQPYASASK